MAPSRPRRGRQWQDRSAGLCNPKPQKSQIRKGPPTLLPLLKSNYHLCLLKKLVKGKWEALQRKGWVGMERDSETCQRTRIFNCRHACTEDSCPYSTNLDSNDLLLLGASRIEIQLILTWGDCVCSVATPRSCQEIQILEDNSFGGKSPWPGPGPQQPSGTR